MAEGNNILLNDITAKGVYLEGIIDGALKPGTIMELKDAVAAINGRFTWRRYQSGTDGDRQIIAVLLPDKLQGKIATDAYSDGSRCFMYVPQAGEQLNVLVDDISGTGDDHAIGDLFIVDTETGRLIATTGDPESEPFQCMEVVTDPEADTLVHCIYTGY